MNPLQVASNVYSLIMENEHVRVMDARFGPGVKAVMHSHPNHVVYVLSGGKIKISTPDGKSNVVDFEAGQTMWVQGGDHASENIDNVEVRNFVVELK